MSARRPVGPSALAATVDTPFGTSSTSTSGSAPPAIVDRRGARL
jgi:hypothetical protein